MFGSSAVATARTELGLIPFRASARVLVLRARLFPDETHPFHDVTYRLSFHPSSSFFLSNFHHRRVAFLSLEADVLRTRVEHGIGTREELAELS